MVIKQAFLILYLILRTQKSLFDFGVVNKSGWLLASFKDH